MRFQSPLQAPLETFKVGLGNAVRCLIASLSTPPSSPFPQPLCFLTLSVRAEENVELLRLNVLPVACWIASEVLQSTLSHRSCSPVTIVG